MRFSPHCRRVGGGPPVPPPSAEPPRRFSDAPRLLPSSPSFGEEDDTYPVFQPRSVLAPSLGARPACLMRNFLGALRLLLEVNERLETPFEIRVSAMDGVGRVGAVARVLANRLSPADAVQGLASAFASRLTLPAHANVGVQTPDSPVSSSRESLDSGSLARSSSVFSIDIRRTASPEIEVLGSPSSGAASARSSPAFSFGRNVSSGFDDSPPPTPQLRPLRPLRRNNRALRISVPTRQSARLAAKTAVAGGTHLDSTVTAVRRKALLNSLSGCSAKLKKHVNNKNLLSRNKLPLCASEIRRLVDAAGIACSSTSAVDVVSSVNE